MLFKSASANSIVGGSPGLNFLYISINASSLTFALSSARVLLKEGLTFILSIKRISNSVIFLSIAFSISSFVISLFIGINISFVCRSMTSSEAILPTISSSLTGISFIFAASIFLITAFVIFLCSLTKTSLVSSFMMSPEAFCPTSKAGGVRLNNLSPFMITFSLS